MSNTLEDALYNCIKYGEQHFEFNGHSFILKEVEE